MKFAFINIKFAEQMEKFADLCYNTKNIHEISGRASDDA